MFLLNICTLIVVMSLSCSTATNVQLETTVGELLKSLSYSQLENCLYFADPIEQTLYRWDLNTRELTSINIYCGSPHLILPVKNYPTYVVFSIGHTLYILKFKNPPNLRFIDAADFRIPDNYIDDGTVDKYGALWYATNNNISDARIRNTVYRIKSKYEYHKVAIRPFDFASSFVFSLNNDQIIFIDQDTRQIKAYDYISKTGNFDNETVLFDFDKSGISGNPIYIVVDARGNLLIAIANKIVRINYNGKLLEIITVEFGVREVISMTFGGPNLNILYAACTTRSGAIIVRITDIAGSTGQRKLDFVFPNADKY